MRSLRRRLGVTITAGAFLVTAAAATVVVYERWQEARSALPSAIELEAFRLAESTGLSLGGLPGDDEFALMVDREANELASVGNIDAQVHAALIDDIWTATTEQDLAVSTELDTSAGLVLATGVACIDVNRCDTVIVGATEFRFASYATARLGWILGLALAAAAITWVVVRWLIGSALQPVETMRERLTTITSTDLHARISAPATGDEIERLGHTLDETIARLGAAVAANERFVSDAAHELRSPITGVRAAIEVEASGRDSALLDESVAELDRAARLVDDLLVLARRQGDASPNEEIDLDDVVRTALGAFTVRYPDVEVERTIQPTRVRGDGDALARVVTNLLDNAARYGGGRVTVDLRGDGDQARLSIADNGAGVPEEERQRVFERFARLDEARTRSTGGSGLGLAIVRELINAHDGNVEIQDAKSGGAKFVVHLPVL
ncbi:MAG: HAMP domain-containing histidine kinase [Actinomycetia bacterium]|nr:HAMP domain-containing histidine kinase [Actinomycetes bacterium]